MLSTPLFLFSPQTSNGSKSSWILVFVDLFTENQNAFTLIILAPVFVLLVRLIWKWLIWKWLIWFRDLILRGRSQVSHGLFMPRHVHGSVHPYGVVELRGRRPYMEDRHAVIPDMQRKSNVTVYAVFDGHGGEAAAQYCTDHIGSVLNEATTSLLINPESALTYAFKTMDQRFLDLAHIRKMDDGTTALVVLAHGRNITVANAGDSRALVVQHTGDTVQLSMDHKPDRCDERDRVVGLGGSVVHWGVWRVEGVLAVSRAIGDRLLKDYVIPDPEFFTWTCTAGDSFLVLATDGLWDVVDNSEVGQILKGCKDSQEGAEVLTQRAFEAGTQDNVTVLVVDVRIADCSSDIREVNENKSLAPNGDKDTKKIN